MNEKKGFTREDILKMQEDLIVITQFMKDYESEIEKAKLNLDTAVKIIAYLLNYIETNNGGVIEYCILDSIKEIFRINLHNHVVKDKDDNWEPIED